MIKSLPALCIQSVSAIVITLCLASPVWAADKLSPRAEVNVRAGTERSILMTEFWAPLAQQSDRVLYGDLRLMGDGDDNREGNLGLGYRQTSPKTNSVLGANAWIDRRRTENGNNFHQITLGVESLGDTIDIRANGYIQLNGSKTKVTPNIGSTTPYLAGSGIFFDTNGFIVEEPQHGFDAEIGYRLPILQKYIDSTRVYAGGYHFFGNTTENTTGFRLRTEAQVNSIFSVGARFQHDEPRGSQGFLEATLRFPFKSKKLYQEYGLRSRLDESPERDIDIVTGAKVDTGLGKQALNASGTEQRILYVDNTNLNSGDGTKENPFNTLASAQAVLQENDILYINRGDGTTTGMNQGITIDKANVQLIGSGSALTYAGYTLLSAGLAPVVTNIIPINASETTGNGIYITGDNAVVSGLTITAATAHGVYAFLNSGTNGSNITITNLNVINNTVRGIWVRAEANTIIDTVTVSNNTSSQNRNDGIRVQANSGIINNTRIINNTANTNLSNGIHLISSNSGTIVNSLIEGNTSNGNSNGFYVGSAGAGSLINATTLLNNTAANNSQNGAYVVVSNNGSLGSLNASGFTTTANTTNGIWIQAPSSIGTIGSVRLSDIIASNNLGAGINILTATGSLTNQLTIQNATTNSNGTHGVILDTAGTLNNVTLNGITASNNTQHGLYIASNTGTTNNITATNIVTNNNTQNGVMLYALGANGSINGAVLSSVISSNNNLQGILLQSSGSSSIISNVSVSNSDFLNNTQYGIFVYQTNAGAIINADFGTGAYGSAGQNRIFGNTSADFRMAYTSTIGSIIARNNWWGVSTAPTRVMLSTGVTLDTANFLTADPRP